MNGLNRTLAPLSERAWNQIESEVSDLLRLHLAARRIVDFEGPLGWNHSAVDLGRVETLEGRQAGVGCVRKRLVRPLIELRVPFDLERSEIERIDRGSSSAKTDGLMAAARDFAAAEDSAIFVGYGDADIPGLLTDSDDPGLPFPEEPEHLPAVVSEALARLRAAGVDGPYALVLGPDRYKTLETSLGEGGYPLAKHIGRLLDGPVIWAPSMRGGLVASLRGGDFRMVCGRDASIGYSFHDEDKVHLYLEESFSFVLDGPEAVIPLLAG